MSLGVPRRIGDCRAELKIAAPLRHPAALWVDSPRNSSSRRLSYISAATMMDIVNTPAEFKDFFGTETGTRNPAVTRIHVPLLAFFGTNGDVGNEADLKLLTSSLRRQSSGPTHVTTAMIKDADHMYPGEEQQVAGVISTWSTALPNHR